MPDKFQSFAQSILSPSENAYAVVPHDDDELPEVPKYLFVGGAGSITLRTINSQNDVVFENIPAGAYLYVRPSHIRAAGTTATSIVACA